MKILLFGQDGQLGTDLNVALADMAGVKELVAYGIDDLNLIELERLKQLIRDEKPDLIINAAAYTAVDKAESDQQLAATVNASAPAVMAEEASAISAGMIHYSTDYVFDGSARQPYVETDQPNPESVYGSTKLDGEHQVQQHCKNSLILRTSWVYSQHGQNFLRTMLRLAEGRDELNVVGDQIGAPTTTKAITDASIKLVQYFMLHKGFPAEVAGVFHMTCGGETSWCGFARAIFATSEFSAMRVIDIPTSEYPTAAKRPAYTVLSNEKLFDTFGIRLPDWQSALSECMQAD